MFYSILFPDKDRHEHKRLTEPPDYFKDLNLDQIVESITKGRSEFVLEPFFYTPLKDIETIIYRQDVMRDLDDFELLQRIKALSKNIYDISKSMAGLRKQLQSSDSYNNNYLTKGYFLDSAERYCCSITSFIAEIDRNSLKSSGLKNFFEYLAQYAASVVFTAFADYIKRLRTALKTVEYCMLIKPGTISVRKYEQQNDHSKQILEVFDKFKQDPVKDYRHKLREGQHAAHVEAAVLNMVASWYKEIFSDLDQFCKQYLDFMDQTICLFAREVQFYIAYQEYMHLFRQSGLGFCYPKICVTKENIIGIDSFDLALAGTLYPQRIPVVNEFYLASPEKIIVVTGPNQGGKTTFARMFGQLHHLGCIGCPVPGSKAALFLFDNIYTHFAREEELLTLNGKLQDDLVRFKEISDKATSQSIIIINEIFSSTTLQDAILLGRRMMKTIIDIGAMAICVTFLDELASYSAEVVSMMSTVEKDDPTQRTFKIIRQAANGLAYAIHIAKKHGLTYETLCERLQA